MAEYTLDGAVQRFGGLMPAGNITGYYIQIKTDEEGKVVGLKADAAPAAGDVLRLKKLPAGMILQDALIVVSKAIGGLSGSLGFAYADGVDVEAVPEDEAHFGANITLSAAARLRCTTAKAMVRLPKEAWLTLTVVGAPTGEGVADIVVFGERLGE